jgi:hypothetical protein
MKNNQSTAKLNQRVPILNSSGAAHNPINAWAKLIREPITRKRRGEIRKAIAPGNRIRIDRFFFAPGCPYCWRAKN